MKQERKIIAGFIVLLMITVAVSTSMIPRAIGADPSDGGQDTARVIFYVH